MGTVREEDDGDRRGRAAAAGWCARAPRRGPWRLGGAHGRRGWKGVRQRERSRGRQGQAQVDSAAKLGAVSAAPRHGAAGRSFPRRPGRGEGEAERRKEG